ncbi:hypothetical protein [Nocardioides speluncae]|uniref:hypothetical protein n=1 Tax=Nocardioides speluncae TaxID=2670337 RepID=UPI000D685EA9|nr:hypothetical protein [Nocardioides speluncae]
MKRTLALAALLLLVAACGSETTSGSDGPGNAPSDPDHPPLPISVDPPKTAVTGIGTVMDTGRPELCLGAVAESYPPQCGGIPLTDWDWARQRGQFEHQGDVRWGSFVVTGMYDGTTMKVTKVVSSALYDPPADPGAEEDPFATPCPEPDGGWRVVDETKADETAMEAAFTEAAELDGYGGAWMDQHLDPQQSNDPSKAIVNVAVTGDPAAAEAELRKVWGGALCVSKARYTEAELTRIQDELMDLPDAYSAGSGRDQVTVDVLWDDGSLQKWADDAYGAGLVKVTSALRPTQQRVQPAG